MDLHAWLAAQVARARPQVEQFGQGVLTGAGLPRSVDEARGAASLILGNIFGIPSARDELTAGIGRTIEGTVEMAKHPIRTGQALAQAARQNPAGAAGVTLGMALPGFRGKPSIPPFSPLESALRAAYEVGDLNKAAEIMTEMRKLEFGQHALGLAQRRIKGRTARREGRVQAERAAVHESLEGPTGSLPHITERYTGGDVEELLNLPDATLVRTEKMYRKSAPDPELKQFHSLVMREMQRRGLKTDISEDLQLLHEGPPAPIGVKPHMTDVYYQQLRNVAQAAKEGDEFWGRAAAKNVADLENPGRIFTAEERGQQMLEGANLNVGRTTGAQGMVELARLQPQFRRTVPGTIVAFGGKRLLKGPRTWTVLEGKPRAAEYQWIMDEFLGRQVPPALPDAASGGGGLMDDMGRAAYFPTSAPTSDIEGGIRQLMTHGNLPDVRARALMSKHIFERMQAGTALPGESAWYNLYQMRAFGKGGMRWTRGQ